MKKRNKKPFNAISLRTIMVMLVCIAFAALAAGFYYAHDKLTEQAKEVSSIATRLTNSGTSQPGQDLSKLQAELELHRGVNEKINNLTVPLSNLQSRAIQDINNYSQKSGVSVENFTFGPTADNSSLKPNDVTVILKNPVDYNSLIKFIQLIETNLPKMNLQGINITAAAGGQSVTVGDLIIGVSTR
jgi:uncharacterized protein YoxC